MSKPLFSHVLNLRNAVTSTTSAPPAGPAGGDLAGSTYPNPVIAPGTVTSGKLAPGATTPVTLQDTASGGATVGTTEALVIDLDLSPGGGIIAGRWALILAALSVAVSNSSGAGQSVTLTINVRYGGTAGVANGTILQQDSLGIVLPNGTQISVPTSVAWLLAPAATVTRMKLSVLRTAATVTATTDWTPRLSVIQFA